VIKGIKILTISCGIIDSSINLLLLSIRMGASHKYFFKLIGYDEFNVFYEVKL
jgi:hypothetical protein